MIVLPYISTLINSLCVRNYQVRRSSVFRSAYFLVRIFNAAVFKMPVEGANKKVIISSLFGITPGVNPARTKADIFAKEGTHIRSSVIGMVVYTGQLGMGGNVVVVLGPKWRFHYYVRNLQEIKTKRFAWVSKSPLLPLSALPEMPKVKCRICIYAITTLLPYFWRIDKSQQGWNKMFYLNPITYLNK